MWRREFADEEEMEFLERRRMKRMVSRRIYIAVTKDTKKPKNQ